MSAIVPFDFEQHAVRIVDRDGQPWFSLNDVCAILEIANPRDAASRLDDDERDDVGMTDSMGRQQATTVINEAGLYRLVLRSRKPEAKRFGKWVVGVVLPTIRRTGAFGAPAPALDLNDPRTLQQALLGMTTRTIAAEERVAQAEAEADGLRDKATALDRLADSTGLLCMSDAAKTVGMGPRRFIAWLMLRGWIFKRASGAYSASQARLNDRTLALKTIRIPRSDGTMRIEEQVMVTAKGLTRLAALVEGGAHG